MNRWVTLSANQQGDYAFMLPISAMCWRKIAKYEPMALLTETREHWDNPTGRVVLDMIARMEIRKHFIGVVKEPYRTSVQAQAARQHAASHKMYPADDYVLTADVDMLPLAEHWFNKQDWSKDVHIWYANAWSNCGGWFTTGYIGARVGTWREFMKYEPCGEIAPILEAALERHLTPERDTWQEWFFDENYTSARLKAWSGYPDRVQFMERTGRPPSDRLDRSNWGSGLDGKVDAHALRPANSAENWPKMFHFFKAILGDSAMEYIDGYYKRYMAVKA